MFEARQNSASVDIVLVVLQKQLTSSVDDQIIGLSTDRDGGDIRNILVGDRARAGAGDRGGLLAVDRVDTGVTLLDNVADRRDVGVLLQRQDDRLSPALKGCGGHRDGSNGEEGGEQHGAG